MSERNVPPPPLKLECGATAFRMTIAKYEELARLGTFGPEDRVELIRGVLVEKMTIGTPHQYAVTMLSYLLRDLCGHAYAVYTQQPVQLPDDSMPEPDVFVAVGSPKDYLSTRVSAAVTPLVIEVAESTLAFDLGVKAGVYAAAKIPEYWVVDLVDKVVRVHTSPRGGRSPGYRSVAAFGRDTTLPVALRGHVAGSLAVKEFLP